MVAVSQSLEVGEVRCDEETFRLISALPTHGPIDNLDLQNLRSSMIPPDPRLSK
jgi:hypothetical protein